MDNADCLRKFQFINRIGYVPKLGRPPLDWGNALHRGVAAWRQQRARGGEVDLVGICDEAVTWYNEKMCLKDHPRSGENLRAVLMGYFDEYANDEFTPLTLKTGEIAVELPYEIPLYENEHTIVLLSGKLDEIGFYQYDKRLIFKDLKHSSSHKPQSHMEEQLSRAQFHVYAYALKCVGLSEGNEGYLPLVVDAVYIDKKRIGGTFVRSPVTVIEPFLVARTMANFRHVARILADLPDDVEWPYNYMACYGKYSRCEFFDVCQSPSATQKIPLEIMFDTRVYNPATF